MVASDVSVVILCTSIRIFHKVTNPHEAPLNCEEIPFIHIRARTAIFWRSYARPKS